MYRLLITGGSGLLGSQLRRAAKGRYQTFATFFSRAFDGGIALDVRDDAAVERVFADLKPDAVIHTAYDKARADVIVTGSANVARAAHAHGARLIHLSTDVVFSGASGAYREDDVPDAVTEYGRMKSEAERMVMAHAPDATLVRTSLIYTRDGDDTHSRFVLDGIRAQRSVTLFTDEYRNPILVDDLADALLEIVGDSASETPPTAHRGILHVAGAERVNRYEFGVLIARYHGCTTQWLVPTTPDAVGMTRPKDCSLDSARAQALLRTRLRGVSEVLDNT